MPSGNPQTKNGPLPLEVMYRFLANRGNLLKFINSLVARYGENFWLMRGDHPIYMTTQLEAIQQVLSKKQANYAKTVHTLVLSEILGDGLVTSDGDVWKKHRRIIRSVFQNESMQEMFRVMNGRVAEVVEDLEGRCKSNGGSQLVEAVNTMNTIALDLIANAMFGLEIGNDKNTVIEGGNYFFHTLAGGLVSGLLHKINIFQQRRLRDYKQRIDDIVYRLIASKRKSQERGTDFIKLLLDVQEGDQSSTLTDEEIRDEAITMLMAGHETVANTLVWSLTLLANNPEKQEELAEQCRHTLGREPATVDCLEQIPMAAMVFEETLRLYPPAWLLARMAIEDDELCGTEIPAGGLVLHPVWHIHRSPDLWNSPEEFEPDRFSAERRDAIPKGAYLPFNIGARACVGKRLAMVEGALVLAALCSRFRFTTEAHQQQLQPQPQILMRPPQRVKLSMELR